MKNERLLCRVKYIFLVVLSFLSSPHTKQHGKKASACPRLSKPSHGTILPTNCMYGETFAGERCFLHCPSGYKALGKRVAVCNQKLEWQPQAQLECVPAQPRPTVSRTSTSAAVSHKFHHHQQQQQFRPTIKCPEDMHILKPKHQETVHVKIPKPETNVDWEMHVDSQPAWAKRLETFLSVGSFEVVYRAKSPFSNQFDLCRFIVNVVDPEPPTVKFCPDPFVVQLHAQETSRSITWQEPIFESKHQPIKQVFKSKHPGHSFTTGVYPITYIATTDDGLSAKCTFRITVKGKERFLSTFFQYFFSAHTNGKFKNYRWLPSYINDVMLLTRLDQIWSTVQRELN